MNSALKVKHHQEKVEGPRGLKIFRQSWLPTTENGETFSPKAILFLVHGLAEHSGRYATLVNDMCDQGYGVFGLDHLGHGQSEGERCCLNSFVDYRQPLHDLINEIKQTFPTVPRFLLGHSMGGLISVSYLLDFQAYVSGAILSAPLIVSRGQPNLSTILKLVFYSLVKPNKGMLKLDAAGVSRNPEVVKAYLEDPLVYSGAIPAGLLVEISRELRRVQKNASEISLPLLILQGDKDAMVDPIGAQLLFDRVLSADKELEHYPEAFHEILNEEEYPQILQKILVWLDRQTKAK